MLIRIPLSLSFGVALSSTEILLAHYKLTTGVIWLMLTMTRGNHRNSSQKTSSTYIQLIGKLVCVVRSLGFPGPIQAHQHNPRAESQILNYSDADEWCCKCIYLGNHHSWWNRSHWACYPRPVSIRREQRVNPFVPWFPRCFHQPPTLLHCALNPSLTPLWFSTYLGQRQN